MELPIKNYTDILANQAKTEPQETLENEITKPMITFSLKTPLGLEEDKLLLGVTSLEA